jgi:hypothetical protein
MHPVGYSTGALALGDFRAALDALGTVAVNAVELSALREAELAPLVAAIPDLDLSRYAYISVHAPSAFPPEREAVVVTQLMTFVELQWPVVVHPDAIRDFELWAPLGDYLLIENMDKRKPIGRTARELTSIFERLPTAGLCFDIAHARQVDRSMTEAYLILKHHGTRVRQLHVSEVNTSSRHDRISFAAAASFRDVAGLIPEGVPIILETPVIAAQLESEFRRSWSALTDVSAIAV